ncbi:MAG: hypothetical protein HYX92_19385 [Chloroflexi bacterium]|nr:hypothetical protein [Chloroflexota bacterium]
MTTNAIRVRRIAEPVLEPANAAAEEAGEAKLAPRRLASLRGARIGLYNNRKPLGALALDAVERLLRSEEVGEVFTGWSTMSNKPPEETLSQLATADAVILAAAD